LQAVRAGQWKLHLPLKDRFKAHYTDEDTVIETSLYNLHKDIGETNNLADKHPEIVKQLMQYADWARNALGDTDQPSHYVRPAGILTEIKELKKEINP